MRESILISLYLFISVLALGFFFTGRCHASEVMEEVKSIRGDVEETKSFFKRDSRFVLVPNPISDPTIGTGLALGVLYLHPQEEDNTASSPQTSVSGVVGMYTDSDSWAAGIFHDGYYSGDRYRVRGILGYGVFNLKYYGIGNDSILRDHPIDYEAKGILFVPRVIFRLPWQGWYSGLEYYYLDIDTTFKLSDILNILPDVDIPTRTAGLGLVLVYDSRDNNFWPSKGMVLDATVRDYGQYFSGDFDYTKFIVKFSQYFSLTDKIIFAYRVDGQFIGGDAPFYDLSKIRLRGLPSGSFADRHAVTAQAEVRWNVYRS